MGADPEAGAGFVDGGEPVEVRAAERGSGGLQGCDPLLGRDVDGQQAEGATEAQHLLMLVKRLQSDLGLAVLLIEHFVRMVLDNCGSVTAIAAGQVIASGPPDVVAASEAVQTAYLGEPL